jgi:Xaa-Pro aminopeptidase
VPLAPGMVITNEPGYYKAHEYGIRIENILTVVDKQSNFLGFDNLTLVPYCKQLIVKEMLDKEHLKMIDSYYQEIEQKVKPGLD